MYTAFVQSFFFSNENFVISLCWRDFAKDFVCVHVMLDRGIIFSAGFTVLENVSTKNDLQQKLSTFVGIYYSLK